MAICSLPFAFTERYFYPSYWEPVFLFNLIDVIGFGIEDILFVVGLSAFTSTVYAFCAGVSYHADESLNLKQSLLKILLTLLSSFVMAGILLHLNVPMIYGSFLIMILITTIIILLRRDLLIPGFTGGLISAIIYTGLCLCLAVIFPGVFKITWHTERFLNIFIMGIPLEEMLYAFASGSIGTVFYPFVLGLYFRPVSGYQKKAI